MTRDGDHVFRRHDGRDAGCPGRRPRRIDPDEISFTAVLGLVRAHVHADTRCPHCGRRPDDPLDRLLAGVAAYPRNRTDRKRTSGRTPAERRTRHTEEAIYTIKITPAADWLWITPIVSYPTSSGTPGRQVTSPVPRRTAPPGPAAGWLSDFWPGRLRCPG